MKKLLNTLYVMDQDAFLRKRDDAICVMKGESVVMNIPFHVLDGIVLFGKVGCTMALVGECAQKGIGIVILDMHGRFQARVQGPVTGNILLRKEQYLKSVDQTFALHVAKRFVSAKIHNSRVAVQRYIRDYGDNSLLEGTSSALKASMHNVQECSSLDELRGVEGDAAHCYFGAFRKLLRVSDAELLFRGRSRRPPSDPANAMLSFFYSILARECASACEVVGLDPQAGYLHCDRPGRMSLALDLMEELRVPYVDRFVLSAFNRKQITSDDFEDQGGAYRLRDEARKKMLGLWQQRKIEQIKHPFLDERIPLGLLPFVQAKLFSRLLRGDLNDYPAYLWR